MNELLTTLTTERLDQLYGKQNRYSAPQTGQSVWPKEGCCCFSSRKAIMADKLKECWFCRYADFHLNQEIALEVGICCFPTIQSR